MLNKEHITRGVVEYEGWDNNYSTDIVMPNDTTISLSRYSRYSDKLVISRDEMEANASFIAEAFNVLSETDKTPRELLNDFKATEEALLAFFQYATDYIPKADFDKIKKLLNK